MTTPLAKSISTTPSRAYEFGPQMNPEQPGVEFRLWAPSARTVSLLLPETPQARAESRLSMTAQVDGWYRLRVPQAGDGSLYQFEIDGQWRVPDPASRYQPRDVHGPSQVVDFNKLPKSSSQHSLNWRGRPWTEAVIYELHVGTFSPEGNFQGVINKLDDLRALGVTALELMPIADFGGRRNWGYDGVLPYAPDSTYGTPADLRQLIQEAHRREIMVLLDVVYNHLGPEGNYLHLYAKPFFNPQESTPWGDALNFSGSQPVRRFFIENALFWLREYDLDGLRLDAVHAIKDSSPKHFLTELAETIRAQLPPDRYIHLVLENDDNRAHWLNQGINQVYRAQWNDDFHHAAHILATGETNGYYQDYTAPYSGKAAVEHLGRCLAEGFAYQGEPSAYRNRENRGEPSSHLPPTAFVNFLQNHDQIGNRAFGERWSNLCDPAARQALLACLLLAPSPPLLFMGEEWGSEKPFLYFCDFEGQLAQQVREGRRQEFARFPDFQDPAKRAQIPDPNAQSTFQASRLDWGEAESPQGKQWLAFYTTLLNQRQKWLLPRLDQFLAGEPAQHRYEVFETCGLQVRWALSGGQHWQLTANLGSRSLTVPPRILHNLRSDGLQCVYQAEPTPPSSLASLESGQMPAWFVIWQTG